MSEKTVEDLERRINELRAEIPRITTLEVKVKKIEEYISWLKDYFNRYRG